MRISMFATGPRRETKCNGFVYHQCCSFLKVKHMPTIYSVYYYVRTYVPTYVRKYGWTDACMHAWHVCTFVRMYVNILCVDIYTYI
jgi:hypothetical protein